MAARRPLTLDEILDTACDVFVRDGPSTFSLRRVASALGVTPMALYRHVENQEVLLGQVLRRGFEEFDRYLSRSDAGTTGMERLRLATEGFFAFALERGVYFELMFLNAQMPAGARSRETVQAAAEPTFLLLRRCVKQAIDEGDIEAADAHAVAVQLLAQATGMVALHRTEMFGWTDEEARPLMEGAIAELLRYLS